MNCGVSFLWQLTKITPMLLMCPRAMGTMARIPFCYTTLHRPKSGSNWKREPRDGPGRKRGNNLQKGTLSFKEQRLTSLVKVAERAYNSNVLWNRYRPHKPGVVSFLSCQLHLCITLYNIKYIHWGVILYTIDWSLKIP